MKKLTNSILLFLALIFVAVSCKKEELPPVTTAPVAPSMDSRNIVQTQDAIAQLFKVMAYSQAFAEVRRQGLVLPNTCGMPSLFDVEDEFGNKIGEGFKIEFENTCILGTDLSVQGTLTFNTFGTTNPSNSETETLLYFTDFTINGCKIMNLSPNSPIRFQDVADNDAGFDLFEIHAPQTFRVHHTLNSNYTDYVPFLQFDSSTNPPSAVHMKILTTQSIGLDYSTDSAADFFNELQNIEFTFKVEERPAAFDGTPNNIESNKRWKAMTYNSSGENLQNLQIITGSSNSSSTDGLKMTLGCGHFKGGSLKLDKEIRADLTGNGIPNNLGCFYPYQIFDFDYDMQSGDMHLDPIDCAYSLPADDTEACDGWAVRKNYGDCAVTSCGDCNDLSLRPLPTCRIVECW